LSPENFCHNPASEYSAAKGKCMDIFIGYRRDDGGHAHALHEKLLDWYDEDQVFLDHESIAPGEKFTDRLESAIADCSVFLAVIGPHWLSDKNRERLQDENDITRGEIRSAFKHGKVIIPVLSGGATFPAKSALPADIQAQTSVLSATYYWNSSHHHPARQTN
jgi:hypothetical protein